MKANTRLSKPEVKHSAAEARLIARQVRLEYVIDTINHSRSFLNAEERMHAEDVGEFSGTKQLELDCMLATVAAVTKEIQQDLLRDALLLEYRK